MHKIKTNKVMIEDLIKKYELKYKIKNNELLKETNYTIREKGMNEKEFRIIKSNNVFLDIYQENNTSKKIVEKTLDRFAKNYHNKEYKDLLRKLFRYNNIHGNGEKKLEIILDIFDEYESDPHITNYILDVNNKAPTYILKNVKKILNNLTTKKIINDYKTEFNDKNMTETIINIFLKPTYDKGIIDYIRETMIYKFDQDKKEYIEENKTDKGFLNKINSYFKNGYNKFKNTYYPMEKVVLSISNILNNPKTKEYIKNNINKKFINKEYNKENNHIRKPNDQITFYTLFEYKFSNLTKEQINPEIKKQYIN